MGLWKKIIHVRQSLLENCFERFSSSKQTKLYRKNTLTINLLECTKILTKTLLHPWYKHLIVGAFSKIIRRLLWETCLILISDPQFINVIQLLLNAKSGIEIHQVFKRFYQALMYSTFTSRRNSTHIWVQISGPSFCSCIYLGY